jgi:GDP-4-dehydro-6-deoxy-D-mannose reductase
VYGPPENLPVDERASLRPQNPYAVSKAACDLLAGQYADVMGLKVTRLRPFNTCGPGQSEDYVVGTLTRDVAEAELAGADEVELHVGALDVARDFTDVRDVARAYVAGAGLGSGIYNVCSGRSKTVRELIEELRSITPMEICVSIDEDRLRSHDPVEIAGSAGRLRAATGWAPRVPFGETLRDSVDAWREQLSGS